jgi:integrase
MARGRGYTFADRGGTRWRYTYKSKSTSKLFPAGTTKTKIESEISNLIDEHKREVDEALATPIPTVPMFEDYARQWLATVELELEPKTLSRYRQDLDNHLIPSFGAHCLDEITPKLIRDFLREREQTLSAKTGKTYAPDTIRNMKAALSSMLAGAVEDEHISRNPCLDVGRAKRKRAGYVSARQQAKRIKPMNPEERSRFLEACKESRLGVLFTLRVMTGLRPSEPYALRLDSIDWRNDQFTVEESAELETRRVKSTKTGRIRVVDIPTPLAEILRDHLAKLRKRALKKGWGEVMLLFPSDANTVLDHANVATEFRRVLKKPGLPHFTPYDLRHTYASFALSHGAPLTYVAEQMGDSPETVLRYYARWIPSKGKRYADIANGIGPSDENETAHFHRSPKS